MAYDAKNGKLLWQSPVNSGVVAAPVTYEVDGRQYVSIAVGWGGVFGLAARATNNNTKGTVYTYEIGGKAPAPAIAVAPKMPLVSGLKYDRALVPEGLNLYVGACVGCHGVPGANTGGSLPNLGYLPAPMIDNLKAFIINGPATERGMPNFTGKLSDDDVLKIRAFILEAAAGAQAAQKKSK